VSGLKEIGTDIICLPGDEWLGSQTNWTDQDWTAGSFQYDILGINHEYNDIVDANTSPSQILTVQGSVLGNCLYVLSKVAVIDSATIGIDTLWYDPQKEIGVTNWLDGVDVTDDCDVFLKGIGPDGTIYNIGYSRTLSNGNKIAFFSYDPLSLNSSPYYWIGFSESAPHVMALKWLSGYGDCPIDSIPKAIEDQKYVYYKFQLSQNYPNPFNPNTVINYELANTSNVKLTVYDLLGREVKTLVNKNQTAGKHHVTFNASALATGIYVYKLTTTQFSETRKMLLLR